VQKGGAPLAQSPDRIPRRDLLKRAAALGGLAATGGSLASILAACGGGAGTTATQTAATGTPTKASASSATASALLFPIASNPTPNPVTIPGGLSSILLFKNLFGQLIRPDPNTDQPSPDLAQAWEISQDGLTYTFHLRDAVFHDGTPVTAGDVKFTMDLIMDPKTTGSFKTNMGPLKSTNVVDDKTVQMVLGQPYGPFLTMLQYNIYVLPEHALKGQDINKPTAFVENPIGSGPYKWSQFVQGDHLTLTAFDKYWDGKPNIGQVIYEIIADVDTQIAKLKAGELDFVMVEPSQIASISGGNIQMSYANQTNYYYMGINDQNPLFKDYRVRQAMSMALDKQKIMSDVYLGHGQLIASPIDPTMSWAFDSTLQPWPYDVNQAKALLAQAGCKLQNGVLTSASGQPYKFKILVDIGNPTRKQFGLIAQQQWQALGMQPQMDFEEFNNWYSQLGNMQFDTAVEWWITPNDPNAVKGGYYSKADGTDPQHPNFDDPETDKLFDEGVALSTPDQRKPVYDQLQARLKQMQPDVFLLFPKEIRGFSSRVKGFGPVGIRDALYYTYKWTLA
jgi:peptide/nickel transport system substrate-binding protein